MVQVIIVEESAENKMFTPTRITPASTITSVIPGIPGRPKEEEQPPKSKNFHQILRNILIVAQLFGQLPVQGITYPTPNKLNFTFKSLLALYCLLPFIATIFVLCVLIYEMAAIGSDLFVITTFIFNACNLGTTLSLLYIATKWPSLMKQWHSVELHMQRHYGWPKKLEIRVHTIAITISIIAVIEYFAGSIGNILVAKNCSDNDDVLKYYYEKLRFPYIFNMLPFELTSAILLHVNHFFSGFTWCYSDLFIMIMSSALAMRFQQITTRLKKVTEEEGHRWKNEGARRNHAEESHSLWKEIREDYNKLCALCRTLDEAISYLVLMSYSTNLFFILIQLFNSLRNKNTREKIYFFFSFGFLISRTIAVSLYAAWVNDESKKPLLILNSIPSHLFNLEIKRFVQQISFDSVALTGRNFFHVTRGLILSVAGAIVTYELVLIQFNENLLKDDLQMTDAKGCALA